MFLSHLLVRHKTPQVHFAEWLFLGLTAVFAIIGHEKPAVGLAGLGTVLILGAALVLLNRQRIWDNYKKDYRKNKGVSSFWRAPNHIYYTINVMFLWPFIMFLGVLSLYAAYMLG